MSPCYSFTSEGIVHFRVIGVAVVIAVTVVIGEQLRLREALAEVCYIHVMWHVIAF